MTRIKSDFPPREAILVLADDQGRLPIKVTPGARQEEITVGDGVLIMKVRARPKDGEANDAVLKLLAKALGLPTSRLRMLRGATGRDKLV